MTKKIAFLINDINKLGGCEKISVETANSLCDFYEVYLISIFPLVNTPYKLDSRIHFETLNLTNNRVILNYIQGMIPLNSLIRKLNISTLFLCGTNVSLFSALKIINKKTKMFFSDHASIKGTLSDKKGRFIRKYSHRFSDLTITLTQKNVEHYVQYLKADRKKMTFIYNPIIQDFEKRNYDIQSKKIITVGRLSEEKGFDLLVQVAKELLALNKDWQWDIYGDGPLFENVKKSIFDNTLENYVFLKGTTNRIMEVYNDYALYALTSYREGLPLVLLEAKCCRVPIVSFDIDTGPDEIVQNGVNGYLVEAYDVKAMANKINDLLLNEELRKSFSEKSYIDLDKFDATKILQQWIAVIDK